jgi:hypothetical protein
MRKLLFVLFLCSLASNALAKVEMWECDGDYSTWDYYKIDTDIPTVYIRKNSRWIDISNASELLDGAGNPILISQNVKGHLAPVILGLKH